MGYPNDNRQICFRRKVLRPFQVAEKIGGCISQGLGGVDSMVTCKKACSEPGNNFLVGSWDHSPKCSRLQTGPVTGGCWWNNNTRATKYRQNTRQICLPKQKKKQKQDHRPPLLIHLKSLAHFELSVH